jgi:hypothetical protein
MFEARRSHIETRREFERNLNLLREFMVKGKVNISRDIDGVSRMEHGFKSARALPNQRIDLSTINESVRLMANTVAQQAFNKELRDEE